MWLGKLQINVKSFLVFQGGGLCTSVLSACFICVFITISQTEIVMHGICGCSVVRVSDMQPDGREFNP